MSSRRKIRYPTRIRDSLLQAMSSECSKGDSAGAVDAAERPVHVLSLLCCGVGGGLGDERCSVVGGHGILCVGEEGSDDGGVR